MISNIKEMVEKYPKLYTEKRLDLWRDLFSDEAIVSKIENGEQVSSLNINDAMPEQIEYADENKFFLETWGNVDIHIYGDLATVKADYILETDFEVRKGIDLLTLTYNSKDGWKIYNLVYEQIDFFSK